ncbi:MAG: DUF370 domain-containing protein [Clostridia bacterium]|nr:DUF370 domain-containing protein [Clostridia bacterium]
MYVHLGQDTVIRLDEIVGIFDLEKTTISRPTRDFLAGATARSEVINVSPEMPKSFVVTADRSGKHTVYIAQISPATLNKRADPSSLRELGG